MKKSNLNLIDFTKLSTEKKEMIFEWRNHEKIREWMYNKEVISRNEHYSFLHALEKDSTKKYYLVTYDLKDIGIIDFKNINNSIKTVEVGLYAKPNLRGVGTILMEEIILYGFDLLKMETLISEVFDTNHRAIKLYKKFNFKEVERVDNIIVMELKNEDR